MGFFFISLLCGAIITALNFAERKLTWTASPKIAALCAVSSAVIVAWEEMTAYIDGVPVAHNPVLEVLVPVFVAYHWLSTLYSAEASWTALCKILMLPPVFFWFCLESVNKFWHCLKSVNDLVPRFLIALRRLDSWVQRLLGDRLPYFLVGLTIIAILLPALGSPIGRRLLNKLESPCKKSGHALLLRLRPCPRPVPLQPDHLKALAENKTLQSEVANLHQRIADLNLEHQSQAEQVQKPKGDFTIDLSQDTAESGHGNDFSNWHRKYDKANWDLRTANMKISIMAVNTDVMENMAMQSKHENGRLEALLRLKSWEEEKWQKEKSDFEKKHTVQQSVYEEQCNSTSEKEAKIKALGKEVARLQQLNTDLENASKSALKSFQEEIQEAHEEAAKVLQHTVSSNQPQHELVITELKAKYHSRISKLKSTHDNAMSKLKAQHVNAISELNAKHSSAISELTAKHDARLSHEQEIHNTALALDQEKHEAELSQKAAASAAELRQITSCHEDQVHKLEHDLGSCKSANITYSLGIEEELHKLRRQLANAEETAKNQQATIVELNLINTNLKTELAEGDQNYTKALEDAINEATEFAEKVQDHLNNENAGLRAKLSQLQVELEDLKARNTELPTQFHQANSPLGTTRVDHKTAGEKKKPRSPPTGTNCHRVNKVKAAPSSTTRTYSEAMVQSLVSLTQQPVSSQVGAEAMDTDAEVIIVEDGNTDMIGTPVNLGDMELDAQPDGDSVMSKNHTEITQPAPQNAFGSNDVDMSTASQSIFGTLTPKPFTKTMQTTFGLTMQSKQLGVFDNVTNVASATFGVTPGFGVSLAPASDQIPDSFGMAAPPASSTLGAPGRFSIQQKKPRTTQAPVNTNVSPSAPNPKLGFGSAPGSSQSPFVFNTFVPLASSPPAKLEVSSQNQRPGSSGVGAAFNISLAPVKKPGSWGTGTTAQPASVVISAPGPAAPTAFSGKVIVYPPISNVQSSFNNPSGQTSTIETASTVDVTSSNPIFGPPTSFGSTVPPKLAPGPSRRLKKGRHPKAIKLENELPVLEGYIRAFLEHRNDLIQGPSVIDKITQSMKTVQALIRDGADAIDIAMCQNQLEKLRTSIASANAGIAVANSDPSLQFLSFFDQLKVDLALALVQQALSACKLEVEESSKRASDGSRPMQLMKEFAKAKAAFFQSLRSASELDLSYLGKIVGKLNEFIARFSFNSESETVLKLWLTWFNEVEKALAPATPLTFAEYHALLMGFTNTVDEAMNRPWSDADGPITPPLDECPKLIIATIRAAQANSVQQWTDAELTTETNSSWRAFNSWRRQAEQHSEYNGWVRQVVNSTGLKGITPMASMIKAERLRRNIGQAAAGTNPSG